MQQISIKDNIYKVLKTLADSKNIPVDNFCQDIFLLYIKEQINASPKEKSHELIEFYKKLYKNKFLIDSTEVFDEELISKTLLNLNKNEQESIALIKKAIAWYIFCHDSTTQDGKKIPHRLSILLKEAWLLSNAIEATADKTLEYITQNGNLNFKAFNKSAKRGDLNGQTHINLSTEVENLLLKLEYLIDEYNLDKKIKKNVKVSQLFQSNIPEKNYIEEARQLIEHLETRLVNE